MFISMVFFWTKKSPGKTMGFTMGFTHGFAHGINTMKKKPSQTAPWSKVHRSSGRTRA